MTHAEVHARVRKNLDDVGITFYTDIDIDDSIFDAYYWVSIFANTIEKTRDISFQANTPYYDLSKFIPDLFALTGVFDNRRQHFLTYKSRRELISINNKYEVWAGPPEWFFIHSQTYLYIGPQPFDPPQPIQDVDKDLKIFYRAFDEMTVLDESRSFRIPVQGEDCIEFYATADLLEQMQEWSKAQRFWNEFYRQLTISKIAICDRPMPALLNAMSGVKL